MDKNRHAVALVVDRAFGVKLIALAARIHVWIVDTPMNNTTVEVVWRAACGASSLDHGATKFDSGGPTKTPDEIARSILDTIDLHHGEHSHMPPWSVLEVYGTSPTPTLVAAFAELGFSNVVPASDGFKAWRSTEDAGQPAAEE